MTRSDLTTLVCKFEATLTQFKTSITEDLSYHQMTEKIKELEKLINTVQDANKLLSEQHNSEESNGRFAKNIKKFKDELSSLRSEKDMEEATITMACSKFY